MFMDQLPDYRILADLSTGYVLLDGRFPRVTHPFATLLQVYDLHVLGTPPAFILSQDQTLNIIVCDSIF